RVFREALKGIHYPSFGDGPDDPSPKELNLGDQEEVARIIAACSTRHVSKQA
ncbi:MAG: hypothetical protein HYV77_01280, partial [Candidatus Wildermuthbacteria bacterium]|nr:hypothetical protein [Candidatus Wildermuthbacteria bacterium]